VSRCSGPYVRAPTVARRCSPPRRWLTASGAEALCWWLRLRRFSGRGEARGGRVPAGPAAIVSRPYPAPAYLWGYAASRAACPSLALSSALPLRGAVVPPVAAPPSRRGPAYASASPIFCAGCIMPRSKISGWQNPSGCPKPDQGGEGECAGCAGALSG